MPEKKKKNKSRRLGMGSDEVGQKVWNEPRRRKFHFKKVSQIKGQEAHKIMISNICVYFQQEKETLQNGNIKNNNRTSQV